MSIRVICRGGVCLRSHRLLQLDKGVFAELFPLVEGLRFVDNFAIPKQIPHTVDSSMLTEFVLLSLDHEASLIVDWTDLKQVEISANVPLKHPVERQEAQLSITHGRFIFVFQLLHGGVRFGCGSPMKLLLLLLWVVFSLSGLLLHHVLATICLHFLLGGDV